MKLRTILTFCVVTPRAHGCWGFVSDGYATSLVQHLAKLVNPISANITFAGLSRGLMVGYPKGYRNRGGITSINPPSYFSGHDTMAIYTAGVTLPAPCSPSNSDSNINSNINISKYGVWRI